MEVNKTEKTRPFLCIELLNTFSEKELNDLSHIVSCRYFNTDRYVMELLKVLKKSVLGKRMFTPDVQLNVYKKVFSGLSLPKKVLDKKQRSLLNAKMNILIRLAEKYLSIETMCEHDRYKCDLLYPELLKRKQSWLFNRHINKEKNKLDDQVVRDEEYYAQKHKIEKNIFDYFYQNGMVSKGDNLMDMTYNLDTYYLINKLSIHFTMLSFKKVFPKRNYNFELMASTIPLLDLPEYAEQPLVVLFRISIELLDKKDSKSYYCLLDALDKYESEIQRDRLIYFYVVATSYCVSEINNGNLDFIKNMFELYRIRHEKNLLLDDGYISIGTLKNLIITSCRVNEYEWAKEILEYYYPYVRKAIKKSVYQFNLGIIAFHQKEYDKAHDKFIQVDKINTTYDVNTRVLILKCLYEKEKEYNEYTMTAFRSAESFFKTNKALTDKSKKGYVNFIKILMTLYRIRHREGARTVEWAEEQLEQQDVNSDKRWLLEKIEELKGRKERSW